MKFDPYCELIDGNKLDNPDDPQYEECEDCHRYEICKAAIERDKFIESEVSRISDQLLTTNFTPALYVVNWYEELLKNTDDKQLVYDIINSSIRKMEYRVDGIINEMRNKIKQIIERDREENNNV